MKLFYNDKYVLSSHAFDTTRKSGLIADSLAESAIKNIEIVSPESLTTAIVNQYHDPKYVKAVRAGKPNYLASSQGFSWDAGLYPMVLASNGGVVAAMKAALNDGVSGSLSSGLHHAHKDRGAGFCTFNGLAIAAHEALKLGAKNVLILDFDAHCGGGTEELIRNEKRIFQVDVSTSWCDWYKPTKRAMFKMVDHGYEYLETIDYMLQGIEDTGTKFDIVLYNAGVDPHEHCQIGGLSGVTKTTLRLRDKYVFAWCAEHSIPVAFVLAGGYQGGELSEKSLINLHRNTIGEAARAQSLKVLRHKKVSKA